MSESETYLERLLREMDERSELAVRGRQAAIECILGQIVAAMTSEPPEGGHTVDGLLAIMPDAFLDRLEGDVFGTAYANVFDRVRAYFEYFQDKGEEDEGEAS